MQKSAAVRIDRKTSPFSRDDIGLIRKIRSLLRTGKEVLLELDSNGSVKIAGFTLEEC